MASSLITQSFCQPQMAAAMSHLSSLMGGLRAASSQRDMSRHTSTSTRHRQTSTVTTQHSQKNTKELKLPSSRPDVTEAEQEKSFEALTVENLQVILKEVRAIKTPTTVLVDRARESQGQGTDWTQCHTSAQSFFENKTGFPKSQLSLSYDQLPTSLSKSLRSAVRDPLFRRIFNSLVETHKTQLRGFKTVRSRNITGLGLRQRKDENSNLVDNLHELFNSKSDKNPILAASTQPHSQPSSSTPASANTVSGTATTSSLEHDSELEKKLKVAFAEGYQAREDSSKKRNTLFKGFLLLALSLFLLSQLLGVGISVKSGSSLGFLNGMSYEVNSEDVNVSFADVKGAAEAKQELQDVVNFLKDPEKYTALGAKLPKGVLLVGPPGVGKTLLARAVAGEAGVPFFHASGSEFDEMFVGLGAKRIRQLFTAAKAQSPCIIFIDEFDSVGAKRTSSAVHPYANQTVNQLLSEMDGFQQNEGIIVVGATNKVDNLDKALRRPGRFDVEVTVNLPDFKGRKEIIELYISKVKKDQSVDVDKIAKGTTGFSGAELENLVNQAALKAVIDGDETVTMDHLEFARDKIIMGPERKHRIPDEETNWVTAYHEAGHTLVAYYTKDAVPLHKVTIIPRGQSLGHTSFIDEKEIYNRTVSQLRASMDTAMGGRAAEELIYGADKVTTGASSDLLQATRVATAMVMASGMSEKVGLRAFSDTEISPAQREVIDSEIKRMLQESYERAKHILKTHQNELVNLAKSLMRYETLDKEEITLVVEGKPLNKP